MRARRARAARPKQDALRHYGGPAAALHPSEIADVLLLDRNRVTTLVDRLRAGGLVDRFEDPSDRRHIVVRLAPPGKQALDTAFAAYQEGLQAMLGGLDAAQSDAAIALLRTVLLGVQHGAQLDADRPDSSAY